MKKKTTTTKTNTRRTVRPANCYFEQTKTTPDYKEVLVLKRFINDRGKIISSKYTGISSKNQRHLSQEIKKARFLGLLAYTDRHAI